MGFFEGGAPSSVEEDERVVLKRQLWIVCVLPWFGRTVGAFGAKE